MIYSANIILSDDDAKLLRKAKDKGESLTPPLAYHVTFCNGVTAELTIKRNDGGLFPLITYISLIKGGNVIFSTHTTGFGADEYDIYQDGDCYYISVDYFCEDGMLYRGSKYVEDAVYKLGKEEKATTGCNVSSDKIRKAEQVLVDNGIDPDEAETVLQALGYVLLDTELYPDELHSIPWEYETGYEVEHTFGDPWEKTLVFISESETEALIEAKNPNRNYLIRYTKDSHNRIRDLEYYNFETEQWEK